MKRRTWLGLSGAVAVAAAGAGWWFGQRGGPPQPAATAAGPTGLPASSAPPSPDDLWSQTYPRPDGGTLALASLRGRPLLINFWATWCPPCVRELPQIDQFAREQAKHGAAGWQVIGVAVDQGEAVRTFLQKTPVTFPIGLAGFAGTELARQLGNTGGGLPFTVLLGTDGQVLQRKLGETSLAELQGWIR